MQSLQLVVVVGISLLLSSLGHAAPIEYLRDDRSLYIQGYLGAPVNEYYYRDDRPPVPFQSWTGGGPDWALITSNVYPDRMSGQLEGGIRSDWPSYPPGTFEYSEPIHDITFRIAETQLASLVLTLHAVGDDWIGIEGALYRPDGVEVMGSRSIDFDSLSPVQFGVVRGVYTATLEPGKYRLRVALHPLYTEQPQPGLFAVTEVMQFQFQVVPEPESSALLALGLIGLAATRRAQITPRSRRPATSSQP